MKWPFVRHAHPATAPAAGDVGSTTTVEPARAEPAATSAHIIATARRDWATLPPLQVTGGRPISLTVAARAFTEGLATQQVLVRPPRLEMVRQIDAPSGSFRGVLAPSVVDHDVASAPELQESSPLPAIEHRHVTALTGEHGGGNGRSAVEQLLAIDLPGGHDAGGSDRFFSRRAPDAAGERATGGRISGGWSAGRSRRFAPPWSRACVSRPAARGDAR